MHPTAFIDASPVHAENSEMKPIEAKQLSVTFKNAKVEQFVAEFALKDTQKSTKQSLKTILPVVLGQLRHSPHPTAFIDASPVHTERSEMKTIEAKQSTRGNPEKADPKTQYDL